MRIAITGGLGFVGSHLGMRLASEGHEVVLITRSPADRHERVEALPVGLASVEALTAAFRGCDAVAHVAGINREIGAQTYAAVHVEGTRNVVAAAQAANVRRLAVLSFLRARPGTDSGYHESKWQAEQIVRESRLTWTVLKAGVIYGRGDHMLDHLSHALHTWPIFALVGLQDRPVRPVAVHDVVAVLVAALTTDRLAHQTVAVMGPETMWLGDAVRRVGEAVGRRPLIIRAPVGFHRLVAAVAEAAMKVPLVSKAQVRILSEGIVEPAPFATPLPSDLEPRVRFDRRSITAGLPEPGPFGLSDLRRPDWCRSPRWAGVRTCEV